LETLVHHTATNPKACYLDSKDDELTNDSSAKLIVRKSCLSYYPPAFIAFDDILFRNQEDLTHHYLRNFRDAFPCSLFLERLFV
jgi:hypothetical protein